MHRRTQKLQQCKGLNLRYVYIYISVHINVLMFVSLYVSVIAFIDLCVAYVVFNRETQRDGSRQLPRKKNAETPTLKYPIVTYPVMTC